MGTSTRQGIQTTRVEANFVWSDNWGYWWLRLGLTKMLGHVRADRSHGKVSPGRVTG